MNEPKSLSLYHFESCPFCMRVRDFIENTPSLEKFGIEYRDIQIEPQYRQELLDATGKTTVPCLKIELGDGSVKWMHESLDIISYLQKL